MAPSSTLALLAAFGAAAAAAASYGDCKPLTAPTAANFSTQLQQQTRRSGVYDFAAFWQPVKKSKGYDLCWDIVGQDKFTDIYVKSENCVRVPGQSSTIFNNGERTPAAPRYSNQFQNVRVASVSACGGVSDYTNATLTASPAVPYVCSPDAGQEVPATATVNLTAKFRPDGTATGTVSWVYANSSAPEAKAQHMVCIVQTQGGMGITTRRTCHVVAKRKSSARFTVAVSPRALALLAEIRPLPSCVAGYDASSPVLVPQRYVPWGANLVNTKPQAVCLASVNGALVYSPCNSSAVDVLASATVSAIDGWPTGVFTTQQGQCVVLNGTSVVLGACPVADGSGGGWNTWKHNSVDDAANDLVRVFPESLCMPFGSNNTVFGQKPTLVDCASV